MPVGINTGFLSHTYLYDIITYPVDKMDGLKFKANASDINETAVLLNLYVNHDKVAIISHFYFLSAT